MLFLNNDYSRGLAGHMRPVTSTVWPGSAKGSAAGCVIFRPIDWSSNEGAFIAPVVGGGYQLPSAILDVIIPTTHHRSNNSFPHCLAAGSGKEVWNIG